MTPQRFENGTRFEDAGQDGYRIDLHAANEELVPQWIIAAKRTAETTAEPIIPKKRELTVVEVKTQQIAGYGSNVITMREDARDAA